MTKFDQHWPETILPIDATVGEAIQILNQVALKIVLVTDLTGVFVGTIADGDIRRGLLKGISLKSPIASIIHRDALVVPPDLSHDKIAQLMSAHRIQQIPIVDEDMKVVGLHLWDEIHASSDRHNTMVIMVGGKGTRLLPQTENCPKPMLQIAGKPILEHIINRAKAEGFSNFVLAIYHLGEMIEEYFGNGKRFGVKIKYIREETPLGTAGALSLFNPKPISAFIVTNGDVLTDVRYGELLDFHIRHNATATMAVRMHEWQNPFGVVVTQGIEIVGYEEKPMSYSCINAGVYVLEPSALKHLTKSHSCDMPTLLERIQKSKDRVIAYPIHEPWLDVGRPDDLRVANREIYLRSEGKNE
jgi:dTDP-glucose pyrophosphorylase